MTKAQGAVLAEGEALSRKWVRVVKQIVRDIARIGSEYAPGTKKQERAKSRWLIYLGLSLAHAGNAVASLAKSSNVRAMLIISRSMFEFQQKAQYFITHVDEASVQFESNFARKYSRLSKLQHPRMDVTVALAAEYLEWRKEHPELTQFSGDVKFLKMHLANAKKEDIKGSHPHEYTSEYNAMYGVTSDYAHGEPVLIGEVFANVNDDDDWNLREDHTLVGALEAINMAILHLTNYAMHATREYGLPTDRLNDLVPRGRRFLMATAAITLPGGFQMPQ